MNDEIKDLLTTLAAKTAQCDDEEFQPDDYAGGNIDDAYSGGYSDGQIELARQILKTLK